jgi:hypothetical protein
LPVRFDLRSAAGLARSGPFDLCLSLLKKQLGGDPGAWMVEKAAAPQAGHFNVAEQNRVGPLPQVQGSYGNRKRRPR